MARCRGRIRVTCFAAVGSVLVTAAAAQTLSPQKPAVKAVSVVPIVSVEGKDNYDAYCAVCHGTNAKGDGPAAPAMKVPVPDLTTIARRHNGKFDLPAVQYIVQGTGMMSTPAHGVEEMPIWGAVFRSEDKARVALRIGNLVKYLESIQAR